MITRLKNNRSFVAGLFTATAASLCCITPLLALLGGAAGLTSSFSWIAPFRPYLIGLTIFVFSFAWYQKLKHQKTADCNCETREEISFWQSTSFLGIVTALAALLITFPYYATAIYPKAEKKQMVISNTAEIKQAEFRLDGLTCDACSQHVNRTVTNLKGVISIHTSYQKATSIIKFDKYRTCVDSIAKAINSTGYVVTSQFVTGN